MTVILKYCFLRTRQIIILFTLFINTNLIAATCTTTSTTTWSCGTPTGSDDLIVNHDITITGGLTLTGSLLVNAGNTLTITGDFDPEGFSTTTILGTLTVGGDMHFMDDAVLTINSGGTLNATGDVRLGDDAILIVNSGGDMNVDGEFRMEINTTATINGTLDVLDEFRLEGAIIGTGTITYSVIAGCSGNGTVNGLPKAVWCDDSGTIAMYPLPIELLWFKAKLNGNVVNLSWSTASEINNDFFTIERSSDIKTWEIVGYVQGAGDSRQIITYERTDENPMSGISYYRLKQTDFDGKYSYSNIEAINLDGALIEKLYPVPSRDFIFFSFSENVISINILNSQGMIVSEINPLNLNVLKIDVSDFISGTYFATIFFDGYTETRRFIVNK